MTDADLPDRPAAIPDWILRQATESHDGHAMLDGLGRALNRAGLPVWRVGIAAPTIDPIHRGITVTWQRGIGTASRLDFTAIGRAVDEASRIETPCDATGRNLLVSDSFARRCGVPLIDLGEFALRGVEAPQRLWTIDG